MHHLKIVGKAFSLNYLKKRYEKEKLHSLRIQRGEEAPAKELLCQRIKESHVNRLILYKTAKTRRCLKYFFKTFFYFSLGLSLAYLFFMTLVYQLHVSIHIATVVCFFLGTFLGLGLAFSSRIRCISCLCIPQLFSKRGRQAMVAYTYILILAGPTRNTLINIGKLSETLLCNQEKMRSVVNRLQHTVREPFIEFKNTIEEIVKLIREEVNYIIRSLQRITHLVSHISDSIEESFIWLSTVVNICNKRLGTPFDRCIRMFQVVMTDCRAQMGPAFFFQCSVTYLLELICYAMKPLEYMCELKDMVEQKMISIIRKGAHDLMLRIKHVFYFNIKFSSRIHVTTNVSKTPHAVAKELAVDMHNKIDSFLVMMAWLDLIPVIFLLLLACKVMWYWQNFMTRDEFDNQYINSHFRDIDMLRAKMDRPTILPLQNRETASYISITSIHLLTKEKFRILRTSIFLFLTTLKMAVHLGADYSLYWLMTRIYSYAMSQPVIPLSSFGDGYMTVSGAGFMVPLFKRIAKLISSVHFLDDKTNKVVCMARPSPPNYDQYIHIATLLAFCWLTTLVEPYILRCRNHIMTSHHPDRARERALWLFREITNHREDIYNNTRKELRKLFVKDRRPYEHITFGEYLGSLLPCVYVKNLFITRRKLGCLLCGETEGDITKCPTISCKGFFCNSCWRDLGNVCSICTSPTEYGDTSDISEEVDSSDEEYAERTTASAAAAAAAVDEENKDTKSTPGHSRAVCGVRRKKH